MGEKIFNQIRKLAFIVSFYRLDLSPQLVHCPFQKLHKKLHSYILYGICIKYWAALTTMNELQRDKPI